MKKMFDILEKMNNKVLGIKSIVLVTLLAILASVYVYYNNQQLFPYVSISPFVLLALKMIIVSILLSMTMTDKSLEYKKGQKQEHWYDLTYEYNNANNWLDRVDSNLYTIGIDLNKLNTFVSPTGNKGKYEYQLSCKYPSTQFVVTDGEIPEDHTNSAANYKYIGSPNLAQNMKIYLNEIGISEADIIWDIKGCIWYSKRRRKLEEVLKKYYGVLSNDGFIVIDAYEISKNELKDNKKMKKRHNKCFGYIEKSTYIRIQKSLKRSKLANRLFDLTLVGEGIYRMAIFQKKA